MLQRFSLFAMVAVLAASFQGGSVRISPLGPTVVAQSERLEDWDSDFDGCSPCLDDGREDDEDCCPREVLDEADDTDPQDPFAS